MSRKTLKGTVVSNKMQQTVVVVVEIPKRHPLYGKLMKNARRFKAHTQNYHKEGEVVYIQESKPFSRQVTWEVVEKE